MQPLQDSQTSMLVVPIECDVLVANNAVVRRDPVRWWPFNYNSLQHFNSPEPLAFDRSTTGQSTGVYLSWTLPAALRQGTQDPKTGAISYPLVPNRWLVLRVQGAAARKAVGWVIESDCPLTARVTGGDASRTSQYLVDPSILALWANSGDAYRTAFTPARPPRPPVANIGIPFALDGWRERAAAAMFLTAVAPANPVFSGYFPHNYGVFSFYDDLKGVDADTLSYYVVGWYSDPTRDIAASWQSATSQTTYADLLARLNWDLAEGSMATATASRFIGASFDLAWDRNGPPPSPDPLQAIRDSGELNVALGNTTIDAFSAMVAQQVKDPATTEILRAFNYDLLPVLDQVNGDALLEARIHQEWFGSSPGGYSWTIAERQSDGAVAPDLTPSEAAWLQQLNRDQAELDSALGALYARQWELNALWYRNGFLADPANTFPAPPQGIPGTLAAFRGQLAQALDPGQAGSVAQALVQQLAQVKGLLGRVPQPDWSATTNRQAAFQAGIARFAGGKGLDPAKVLKAVAGARYWQANNPVVVVSGVEPPVPADPNQPLTVRTITQAIGGFSVGGRTIGRRSAAAGMLAPPGLAKLPDGVWTLVDELFLLDSANAASLAAAAALPVSQVADVMNAHAPSAYQGTLPDLDLAAWTQPWKPLFFEWRGEYRPIAATGDGQGNWQFDGSDYRFVGSDATTAPMLVGGISLLSPHAQFVFGSRLKTFIDKYSSQHELADVWQSIDQIYKWRFLAQELVGFNQTLALRDSRSFRRPLPGDTVGSGANQHRLADLIGYDDDGAGADALPDAYRGRVNTVPLIPNGPALPFQGIRQGQFHFSDLILYDQFGRVLRLISSLSQSGLYDAQNFPALLDSALVPQRSSWPAVKTVAEFAPRPLQGARLDTCLVDQFDDTKALGRDEGVCPVCGWLLPNHLDASVLLYAADGAALGEIRLVTGDDGVTRTTTWMPPAHSSIASPDDVARLAPHLAEVVQSPAFQSEASFTALMSAIDATLWTVDPLGGRADQNLSILVGRPLALVRTRLQFQLDGAAIGDTGWAATFDTTPPSYLSQQFAIRLGDQATRQDGTIGYFVGRDYSTFNSVAAPETGEAQSYVRQIGPIGADGGQNYLQLSFAPEDCLYLTLLVDPRASVHATTGIVPVKQIDIPPAFVDQPLSRMEIGFRLGPLLTNIQATPTQGGQPAPHPTAIAFQAPAEQGGTWSWWESDANRAWTGFGLVANTPDAKVAVTPNSLREGILQLVIDLEKNA